MDPVTPLEELRSTIADAAGRRLASLREAVARADTELSDGSAEASLEAEIAALRTAVRDAREQEEQLEAELQPLRAKR